MEFTNPVVCVMGNLEAIQNILGNKEKQSNKYRILLNAGSVYTRLLSTHANMSIPVCSTHYSKTEHHASDHLI